MRLKRIIVAMAICLIAFPAFAQEVTKNTMDSVRDALKAQKRAFIAVNMQLTDAEDAKFWPVYDSYQAELDKLVQRLLVVILDYADQYKMLSDQKAMGILDEYLAIESERLALRKAYLPKFRQALPDKKVVRFYQLENKIQAAVNYELAANIPLVK